MKTKKFSLILILAIYAGISSAQIKDIAQMISAKGDDAELLFKAYMQPYSNAFGANLNAGWYNTAKPHKLGGFDLTGSISVAFVPKADKVFDVSALGLSANATGDTEAPTVAGKRELGPELVYSETIGNQTYDLAKFNTPKGTGVGFVPSPMLQLGIGLVKGTEVVGRYMPDVNIGNNGKLGLWGVGVKHSVSQWIPGLKFVPVLNISVMGGYTKMATTANLSFEPDYYVEKLGAVDQTTLAFDNQQMILDVSGFTGNLLISADLPVVTFYGGVGFSTTNTNLKLVGDYPLATVNNSGNLVVTDASMITDPFDIEMKYRDGNKTRPRLNAGMKVKMAIVHLHLDYTYANYSVATIGLGINFR